MGVLDSLRIPRDIREETEDDFPRELGDEFASDFENAKTDPVPADSPYRDPAPGEPVKAPGKTRRPRTEPPRVTKKHVEQATEEIETLLEAIALAWGWQAPPCGRALEQAAPDVAAKVAKLVSRNPAWLLRVREGGILADAIGIAIALKPVAGTAITYYSQPKGGDLDGVEFDPDKFPAYDGR